MAGKRVTDLTALDEQMGTGDLFNIVDVNDTTGSAEGTSKKIDSKYIIQTDKFSLDNAAVKLLSHGDSPKILVGALSGYMPTVFNVTVLCTYASSTEGSNNSLLFGFDSSSNNEYWDHQSRMMSGTTTDNTYIFSGEMATSGANRGSILNTAFTMWSTGAFDGGWSMDVYVTYCYTKIL